MLLCTHVSAGAHSEAITIETEEALGPIQACFSFVAEEGLRQVFRGRTDRTHFRNQLQ